MDFFDFLKEKRFIVLSISIIFNIIFCLTSGILLYQNLNFECKNEMICEELSDKNENIEDISEKFFVEIKGAVKNPGVYEASNENIINDIVKLAGGFNKNAYTSNINLSRKVSNELVIFVYTTTEYKKATSTKVTQQVCDCSSYDISNCTENKQSEIVSSNNDTSFENNTNTSDSNNSNVSSNSNTKILVNINTASVSELMSLSGIGESKAKEIVAYREANGNFKNIEEIKNVSGIGDAVFEKIKDSITV